MQQLVLDEPQPLQDYGCFLPEDVFTLPTTDPEQPRLP
jgi:hypothetical protein